MTTASQARLAQLREKLEGRVDPATGKARPGFFANVAELRTAIANLTAGRPELSHRRNAKAARPMTRAEQAQHKNGVPPLSHVGAALPVEPPAPPPPGASPHFHGIVGGVGAR